MQWNLEKKGYKPFEGCNPFVFLAPLRRLPSSKVFLSHVTVYLQMAHWRAYTQVGGGVLAGEGGGSLISTK